jgi:MSHA biogenesis protein MshO
MTHQTRAHSGQGGFTLVELVMVIVLLGVISGMVTLFMKSPIDAYFASARRAGLTDVADTAARRMARDIRKALPNSIRTPTSQCLEFIPTKTGGRYRSENLTAGDGSSLDFTGVDSTFNMLGSNAALPSDQQVVAGDVVAVYNLGISGGDAYNQDNTSDVTALGTETSAPIETPIQITAKKFPLESPARRFHVVPKDEKVVAYVCSGGNLYRKASTEFYSDTSASVCPVTGPILARNLTCAFDYSGSDLQRNALVRMVMQFTENGETISLQQEVHVSNAP